MIRGTEEVEVCVGLGAWQNKTIDTAEGWSRMGAAYHVGANVTCDSRVLNILEDKTRGFYMSCIRVALSESRGQPECLTSSNEFGRIPWATRRWHAYLLGKTDP